jgi:hypothetical protein
MQACELYVGAWKHGWDLKKYKCLTFDKVSGFVVGILQVDDDVPDYELYERACA